MLSHDIRVGATDDMGAFNVFVTLVEIISRGGWEFKGECNDVFSYLTKKLHVSHAGKALAG